MNCESFVLLCWWIFVVGFFFSLICLPVPQQNSPHPVALPQPSVLLQDTWQKPGILKGIAPRNPASHILPLSTYGLWDRVREWVQKTHSLTGAPWVCNLSFQPTHSHSTLGWFPVTGLWCIHLVKVTWCTIHCSVGNERNCHSLLS